MPEATLTEDADLAIENASRRPSGGRTFAHHPHLQWTVAEALLKLEAISAQLERVTSDWSSGADHGELWVSKLFAAKYNAVEGARANVNAQRAALDAQRGVNAHWHVGPGLDDRHDDLRGRERLVTAGTSAGPSRGGSAWRRPARAPGWRPEAPRDRPRPAPPR